MAFPSTPVCVSRIARHLSTDETQNQVVHHERFFPQFSRFPWAAFKPAPVVLTVLGTQVLEVRLDVGRLARTRAI